jgi:hypothetical protein
MNHRLFSIFMAIVLVVAVLEKNSTAQAQDPSIPQTPAPAGHALDYLLLFSMSYLTLDDAPVGINPLLAAEYARQIIVRQFEQLQPQLARYVQSGQISGLTFTPERAGVILQVADPAVLADLQRLPGVAGVYPADKSVSCGEGAVRSLQRALQIGVPPEALQDATLFTTTATDPAIKIYHVSGETGGEIFVQTIPSTSVSMRILRNGKVVSSGLGFAYDEGTAVFYPGSSDTCNIPIDEWELHDGDTVEVSAHGSTVSTVIVPLKGWVDPVANKVGGVTSPGKTVKIELSTATGNDPCNFSTNTQTVTSNASGVYEKTYPDFNRMAYATLSVADANGNTTYMNTDAFSIYTAIGTNFFNFSWNSSSAVTVTYKRGSTTLHTWHFPALYTGGGYTQYLSAGETTKAGDVISVTSAGSSMSYTVVPFSGALDLAGSKITGITGAGRLVQAIVYRNNMATCETSGCATATAGAGGAFSVSMPLSRGDNVYLTTYDAEGNAQSGGMYTTQYMEAEFVFSGVGIHNWHGSNPVTVTLKNSSNVVKQTKLNVTPNANWFYVYFNSSTMAAGDKIVMTDGVNTLTMTVSNLAARLNTSISRLAGTSSNGHLTARFNDFRRDQLESVRICAETQVTTGSVSMAFSGAQFGPQDNAYVDLTGADGNYTYVNLSTFGIWLGRDDRSFFGDTELPNKSVTVTAKRGSTTLGSWTGLSEANGNFTNSLSFTGAFQTGDVINVTTNEGDSVSLTVPNLSISFDPTNQLLYGNAPAGQPLHLYLGVKTGNYTSINNGWIGAANAAGQYSVSTAGRLVANCHVVIGGSTCTYAELDYYFPGKEHVIYTTVANTAPVAADSFEADNTYTTASTYTTIQQHTFDTNTDVDWVKFTVPQAAVTAGKRYLIMTFGLGFGMNTILELYGTNGTTLLLQNDDYGPDGSSFIRWKPTAAGTYYVKVLPQSSDSTSYCGATYSLRITAEKARVFIPLALK